MEFFNFTNAPHFAARNFNAANPNFGRVTATNGDNRNRAVRFGPRLIFWPGRHRSGLNRRGWGFTEPHPRRSLSWIMTAVSLPRAVRTLLIVMAAVSTLPAQQDPAVLAEQSQKAMAEGRFGEAADLYAKLVPFAPENPGLLANQGMALHMAGRDAEAVAPLEKAVKLDAGMFPPQLFLGASRFRLGRVEAAVGPLEQAAKLEPEHPQVRQMLGEAYIALGRPREAMRQWRALARLAPDEPQVWAVMLETYEMLAEEAFEKLESSAPESAEMLHLVAEVRLRQQQYPSAFYLYREARERNPKMRGVNAAIAEIYRSTGRDEWAAEAEKKEAALPPLDCAKEKLACDYAAGRFEAVAEGASKSETPEALFWRARAYARLAGQTFQRLEKLPDSPAKHEAMARIYAGQERHEESAAEWRKALKSDPGNLEYRSELAFQLYLGGNLDEARTLLTPLAGKREAGPQAAFLLGDIHLQKQQVGEAVPLLERAVAAEPKFLPARGSLGRALVLANRHADAIPHLEAALEIDRDGSLHYQLAQALQRSGQRDRARKHLETYQELQRRMEETQRASREMEITAP